MIEKEIEKAIEEGTRLVWSGGGRESYLIQVDGINTGPAGRTAARRQQRAGGWDNYTSGCWYEDLRIATAKDLIKLSRFPPVERDW